jgi:hypothetical protein
MRNAAKTGKGSVTVWDGAIKRRMLTAKTGKYKGPLTPADGCYLRTVRGNSMEVDFMAGDTIEVRPFNKTMTPILTNQFRTCELAVNGKPMLAQALIARHQGSIPSMVLVRELARWNRPGYRPIVETVVSGKVEIIGLVTRLLYREVK